MNTPLVLHLELDIEGIIYPVKLEQILYTYTFNSQKYHLKFNDYYCGRIWQISESEWRHDLHPPFDVCFDFLVGEIKKKREVN